MSDKCGSPSNEVDPKPATAEQEATVPVTSGQQMLLIKDELSGVKDMVALTGMQVHSGDQEEADENDQQPQQQIYIIQTTDGAIPMESAEVVVADDMAVYETVTALEQLSRGQVITTTEEGEQIIQVYEEVVLPDESSGGVGLVDQFVDVQEVEVGDGRSASPVKIDTTNTTSKATGKKRGRPTTANAAIVNDDNGSYLIPLNSNNAALLSSGMLTDLHCSECGKLFKSKRSLFGHKKEKHSGINEVHHCPECGKTFGRKSNLKAHRESLHYGKKFPCAYCERIFTNRSSMNQHIKKTHVVTADMGITEEVQNVGTTIVVRPQE